MITVGTAVMMLITSVFVHTKDYGPAAFSFCGFLFCLAMWCLKEAQS
jgi:hypothetical protein